MMWNWVASQSKRVCDLVVKMS